MDILKNIGFEYEKKKSYIPTRTKEGNCKLFYEMNEEERKEAIEKDPRYAIMVCRCELVTEGDVVNAINRPIRAITVDMVKRRTRAGMGRCQGGFCQPHVAEILADQLGIDFEKVTKSGGKSFLNLGVTK